MEHLSTAAWKLPNACDYKGEDGLLYCGKCHTKKEGRYPFGDRMIQVHLMCKCEHDRYEAEKKERERQERIEAIERMKATCIHDRHLMECTFARDDGTLPQIASAKRYVETWRERKANNDGLLLWGDVGCGKTFYAACVANALIEEGVSVLMTNFSKILNKLSGLYSDDKNEFIRSMMQYSLLIIDDFGIERNTEYALEQVYNIIDERYKTKLPLIVTTNLSLNSLKNPEDTAHKRIYDRVLSMCVPVKFLGINHRTKEAEGKIKSCRAIFEGSVE
ncbi:MAG: ATP-binding protein [Eubacterium sp.]|nr:ATP-binding protein [Eubacterium sp.]